METEKSERKKVKKKRTVVIAICVILASISGYFLVNNQYVKGLYYKMGSPISDKNPVIEFEDGITLDHVVFNNLIISSSKNGIDAYNLSGKKVSNKIFDEVSSVVSNYSDIKIRTCDKYISAYDTKGRDIIIFNSKKIASKVKVTDPIINVKPFDNGGFIVIAEDSSAKNQVVVYNNSGKEEFIWHSGTNHILDATYSYKNGKLVVVTADLSTGALNSKVMFFDISSNEPYAEIIMEDVFITNINHYTDNDMVAIGDKGIYYFTVSGEMEHKYSYNEKMLANYKMLDDGIVVLSFRSNSTHAITEIVSKEKLEGTYQSLNEIIHIDSSNGNILLCENRKITLITKKGFLIREVEYSKDLNEAYFAGKNKIVLKSNSELRIIN